MITEIYMGLPMRSYSRTRAWSVEDFDAAEARLRAEGWLEGDGLSSEGRARREAIERATDLQMRRPIEALGSDAEELFGLLEPWADAMKVAGGYLQAGPHDLAGTRRGATS